MSTTEQQPTTSSAARLEEVLRDRLGERLIEAATQFDQLTVTVEPDALVDAARMCKEDPELAFDFWEFNSPVDLGDEGFALITHLYSTTKRHHINLRIVCPGGRDEPKAPSLTDVYRGANWSEREAFDMFGIEFEGHPQLLPRILTIENFEGWPLRKDFLLSSREAKPWPGAKEPEEQEAGDEGESAAVTPSAAPESAEDKAAAAKAKAERARAKAAEMRKKKAAEREGQDAQDGAPAAEPEAEGERAAAPAAAGEDVPEGTPDPTTPEGAAEVAGSDVAKDAAAGAVGGDTAAGAPGDEPGTDQPVEDLEHEAKEGEGAAPAASGAPGIEAEGRHGGAEQQAGAKPAEETPGMNAEPQGRAARAPGETPAPGPDDDASATRDGGAAEASATEETSTAGGDDADVPVEPAPGAAAAPLASDKPSEEAGDEAGLDEDTPAAGSSSEQAQPEETFEGGERVRGTDQPPAESNPDVGPGSEGMGLTDEQREDES